MPQHFIPFSDFIPDQGRYNNPGLLNADNVAPLGPRGYVPLPTAARDSGLVVQAFDSETLGGDNDLFTITGSKSVYLSSSGQIPEYKMYTGTKSDFSPAGELQEWYVDAAGAITTRDVTRAAGGRYAVQVEGWDFVNYGDNMIAVMGHDDDPQVNLDVTSGSNKFVALMDSSRYDIRAKYCSVLGFRALMGNCYESATPYPNRVWWSATDNIRYYGDGTNDPALRTDFQDLDDEMGPITGIIGAANYAYIFKPFGIYRMDLGGPFQYQFRPFAINLGTLYPHSIVNLRGDTYFWGPSGPAVIRGTQAFPLGLGVFNRALKDTSWLLERPVSPIAGHAVERMHAFVDPENDLVCWAFNSMNERAGDTDYLWYCDTVFIYNARFHRGSVMVNWSSPTKLEEEGAEAATWSEEPPVAGYQANPAAGEESGFRPVWGFNVPANSEIAGYGLWGPLLRNHWIMQSQGWQAPDGGGGWDDVNVWGYAYPDLSASSVSRFRNGFFNPTHDAGDIRIRKARLIYSVNASESEPSYEIMVRMVNTPAEPARGPWIQSQENNRGWLTWTKSPNGPFAQLEVQVKNPLSVAEFEGVQIDYELAGRGKK